MITLQHQYSHKFPVGACTGLYKPVRALKVERLQEKQAMSDFPQVQFLFVRQVMTSVTSPQVKNQKAVIIRLKAYIILQTFGKCGNGGNGGVGEVRGCSRQ
jgi:hypothetical protein